MCQLRLNFKTDKITEVMDNFLAGDENGNPYDKIELTGFVPSYFLSHASVILEPIQYDSKQEYVSLSQLKKEGLTHTEWFKKYYSADYLDPTKVCRFALNEDEIIYVKAQCTNDRSGFYKEFWEGTLVDEKNYGDCSCYFMLNELIIYPAIF